MIQESLLYTTLMMVAVVLTCGYVYTKLKSLFPEWQLRAELAASFAGLLILFALSTIASIPGPEPTWFVEPPVDV